MIQEIDIVVHDDDGIVHDDSQDDDECCNRYLVQGNAEGVHDPHRGEERHRDGQGRNQGNADRQKDNRHQDDSPDGQHEFMAELGDALPDHGRLIRDNIDIDVGRQQQSKLAHDSRQGDHPVR